MAAADHAQAIARANATIAAIGGEIRTFFHAEKREQLRSVLFDVPRRSLLGWYCIWEHGPEFFGELWAHASPEEVGGRMRNLGTRPYQLQMGLLFLGFLGARQQRILDLGLGDGEPLPGEDVRRTADFVNALEALQRAYRGDGTLCPGAAGFQTRILDPGTVARARALLEPLRAKRFRPVQRTLGVLEMYAFLLHGEQRDGVFGHGPYDTGEGTLLFVREINDLRNDYLPWAATEARNPFANVIFAYEARDAEVACDVFGTLVVQSADLEDRLVATGALHREGDHLRRLTEDELEDAQKAAAAATREMYRAIAAWDDRYKLQYGAPLFANHVKGFFDLLGVDEDIGARLMETFEATGAVVAEELLQSETPSVWHHMVHGDGPCFFGIPG